jgi:hypothetical protein
MASPLDQKVYDDSPAYMEIKTFAGNDLSVLVTFPFDTTDYEFSGEVVTYLNVHVCDFVAVKITTGIDPDFVYQCNFSISDTITSTIPAGALFRFKWIQSGITVSTFVAGPIEVQIQ